MNSTARKYKVKTMHFLKKSGVKIGDFLKEHYKAILVLALVNIAFFFPMITKLASYTPGGDALFNAWTITRVQGCILGDSCHNVLDGGIFLGHENTLTWSESQLSTAVLFLPLRLFTDNPVLINNIATITMTFLIGFSMYLLAMYLSGGKKWISIISGLIFSYAPFRLSAVWHLQNLSIFALPLAVLAIFKYKDTKKKRYLLFLLLVMVYEVYASWYQMAFTLLATLVITIALLCYKKINWKSFALILGVIVIAFISVLPLARVYLKESRKNNSGYTLDEKVMYSSALEDYILPSSESISGTLFYKAVHCKVNKCDAYNGYNKDTSSYHGAITVFAAISIFFVINRKLNKKKKKELSDKKVAELKVMSRIFVILAVIGFVASLGPFLKLQKTYVYELVSSGTIYTVPLPYILVEILMPSVSFIRAIGRAGVVVLLALSMLIALMPYALEAYTNKTRKSLVAVFLILLVFDVMPYKAISVRKGPDNVFKIPEAHKVIKKDKDIDNIVVISSKDKNPQDSNLVRKQMALIGYHGKHLYNGHSAFIPKGYREQMLDFYDLNKEDLSQMRKLGIRYILLDKVNSYANTLATLKKYNLPVIHEDNEYLLVKL